METDWRLARGRSGKQHIAFAPCIPKLQPAFFRKFARLAITLEAARQPVVDATVAQTLADAFPVILDFPGEVAREFEARYPAVRIHEALEFRRKRHFGDLRAALCQFFRRLFEKPLRVRFENRPQVGAAKTDARRAGLGC